MIILIKDTLKKIAVGLNQNQILWGLGASLMLSYYGLVKFPNDIDIIISEKDIVKADKIISSFAKGYEIKDNSKIYNSVFFANYLVNDFEVDLIAGFSIKDNDSYFNYIFDENSITEIWNLGGTEIPLIALEDWYILYQLIPNKEYKANLIESYLLDKGNCKIELLEKNILKLNNKKIIKRSKFLVDKIKSK